MYWLRVPEYGLPCSGVEAMQILFVAGCCLFAPFSQTSEDHTLKLMSRSRRIPFAGAVGLLVLLPIAAVVWLAGRGPRTCVTFVGSTNEGKVLIFGLTNGSSAMFDYFYAPEVNQDGQWLRGGNSLVLEWQRPPYRDIFGIPPATGVIFGLKFTPRRGLWRLRVSVHPQLTKYEELRLAVSRRLTAFPYLAARIRPFPQSYVLYGPVMDGGCPAAKYPPN